MGEHDIRSGFIADALSWQLDSSLRPNDYVFDVQYNGSGLYQPTATSDSIRVQAEVVGI